MSPRRVHAASALALAAVLFLTGAASAQPAFQVADINTTVPAAQPFNGELAEAGGVAFFVVSDGLHGYELWRSDGTADGTRLLKDICPGSCSAFPRYMAALADRVFFTTEDPVNGAAFWTSDGTEAGTVVLLHEFVFDPRAAGDSLFFSRWQPATGDELWKTDGTAAGTVLVKDIQPGPDGSGPSFLEAAGGVLYFIATDPALGRELWKTDGSESGTVLVADTRPGPQHTAVSQALAAGGRLFMMLDAGAASELWVTDGTGAGTYPVKTGLSAPFNLTPLGGGLVFTTTSFGNTVLWKSDGTEAGTIESKNLGPFTWRDFRGTGAQVFFSHAGGPEGYELWKTDGTPGGTVLVKDIHPGPDPSLDSSGSSFTDLGGTLLFFADDGTHGFEVWKSDGTGAGTVLVADLEPGAGGSFGEGPGALFPRAPHGIAAGGRWLFLARTASAGWALWKTDGLQAGTELVRSVNTQSPSLSPAYQGDPRDRSLLGLGDVLLFQADDGITGAELWRSDGTSAGTSLVADLGLSSVPSSRPHSFTLAGGNAYFLAHIDAPGLATRLWRSDGTAAGTEAVLGSETTSAQLTVLGDSLFFSAYRGADGNNLWRTNASGTVRAGGTPPAGENFWSDPLQLTPFGNRLVFKSSTLFWATDETAAAVSHFDPPDGGSGDISSRDLLAAAGSSVFYLAYSSTFGLELWRFNSLGHGALVEDIRPGMDSAFNDYPGPGDSAVVGARFFFVADDGVSGRELWLSDGTAAGTFRIADILPGAASSEPAWLTVAGDLVYFVASDGVHGRELWVTDGTPAGTRLVEDIHPGAGSSSPQQLAWRRHTLLFAADDGVHGLEPWVSDGTVATTFLLQDVAPGTVPSSPFEFTETGTFLYFGADDGTHGRELWALPKEAVGSTFGDATRAHWAWRYIEALAASGLTAGCGGDGYCPAGLVTRAQAAVFLLRGLHGSGFVPPPATGAVFTDVPAGYWAAPWIERFAAEGLTSGCSTSPPQYCPEQPLTRAQMAVLLLRAKHGSAYTPPPATGIVFNDVPAGFWAAPWIEQLAAEGITTGCGGGAYCPENPVNRAEMAVFLTRTFNLPLP